jgi:antitoxin VapB
MTTARVFKSGNSQAVRLPKEFRFKSAEVEIFRRGGDLILREKARGMDRVIDLLQDLPEDCLNEAPADAPPQKRKGL